MSITRARLRTLQQEMQTALEKAGITDFEFEVGNMRFTTSEVTVKVEAKLKGVESTSDKMFKMMVEKYGLSLIGRKGETLTGYKSSRPKYPFSYTTVRGAKYKATVEQAQAIFG